MSTAPASETPAGATLSAEVGVPDNDERRRKERHWTGDAASGAWSDEDNWGGASPPTAEHHVYVYKARLVQGRTPYTPGGAASVRTLTLDLSRSAQGQPPANTDDADQEGIGGQGLMIQEAFHWTHGYVEAPLQLSATARLRIDSPALLSARGGDLRPSLSDVADRDDPVKRLSKPMTAAGPVDIHRSHLSLVGDGMLSLGGDTSIIGPSTMSGGMRESCGVRIKGTTTVESGVLTVDDVSFVLAGSLIIKKGATVVLNAATAPHLFASSARVGGEGTLVLSGRLLVAQGAVIDRATRVKLAGGTVEDRRAWELAASTLGRAKAVRMTVSGPMEWATGFIKGDVLLDRSSSLVMSGEGVRELVSGTLRNRGRVELRDGDLKTASGMLVNEGHLHLLGDVAVTTTRDFRLENRKVMTVTGPGTVELGHFSVVNTGRLTVGDGRSSATLHLRHWGASLFEQRQRGTLAIGAGGVLRSDQSLHLHAGALTGGVRGGAGVEPDSALPAASQEDARIAADIVLECKVVPGDPLIPGRLVIEGSCRLGKKAQLLIRDHAIAGGSTASLSVTGSCTLNGVARVVGAGMVGDNYISDVVLTAESIVGGFREIRQARQRKGTLRLVLAGGEVRLRLERGPGVVVDLDYARSFEGALADEEGFVDHKGECATGVQYVFWRALRPLGDSRGWKQGVKVRGSHISPGTAIASFEDGRYTGNPGHAAILVAETDEGLAVLDQFEGKDWGWRMLKFDAQTNPVSNNGNYFNVVEPASP